MWIFLEPEYNPSFAPGYTNKELKDSISRQRTNTRFKHQSEQFVREKIYKGARRPWAAAARCQPRRPADPAATSLCSALPSRGFSHCLASPVRGLETLIHSHQPARTRSGWKSEHSDRRETRQRTPGARGPYPIVSMYSLESWSLL